MGTCRRVGEASGWDLGMGGVEIGLPGRKPCRPSIEPPWEEADDTVKDCELKLGTSLSFRDKP